MKEIRDKVLKISVKNVVATVSTEIRDRIDLSYIARKMENGRYEPSRFPGLILKIVNPRATALIFSTGKMVLTGLDDVELIKVAVKKIIKDLSNIDVELFNPKIAIHNIVATSDLGVRLDLDRGIIVLKRSVYEPEIFPALTYRMQDPKAVLLLFSSGKIVCTGTVSVEKARRAVYKLFELVKDLGIIRQ